MFFIKKHLNILIYFLWILKKLGTENSFDLPKDVKQEFQAFIEKSKHQDWFLRKFSK
jgi:hypothetical protein